jgi:hypothetical protein
MCDRVMFGTSGAGILPQVRPRGAARVVGYEAGGPMTRTLGMAGAAVLAATMGAWAQGGGQANPMTFFITSAGPGDGANLGGLAGADKHCQALAQAAGAGGRTWRAYLSSQADGGQAAVHARDRIGAGPWHNAKGVQIAASVEELHSDKNNLTKETQLNEKGGIVNGRGDKPNRHDILTGSDLDGRALPAGEDRTCRNWTSNGEGAAMVGHHDRQGGGQNPTSWNAAHASSGCSQQALQGTGGDGLFYCFAVK